MTCIAQVTQIPHIYTNTRGLLCKILKDKYFNDLSSLITPTSFTHVPYYPQKQALWDFSEIVGHVFLLSQGTP